MTELRAPTLETGRGWSDGGGENAIWSPIYKRERKKAAMGRFLWASAGDLGSLGAGTQQDLLWRSPISPGGEEVLETILLTMNGRMEGGGITRSGTRLRLSGLGQVKWNGENRWEVRFGLGWGQQILVVLLAHGMVDEGEDVVLDHDGEAEEDGVEHQDVNPQLKVQLPLVDVDP